MTPEIEQFVRSWDDTNGNRKVFERLRALLERQEGCALSFEARPGITYSLRARHQNQSDRPLYVMVDVVDDDPEERWLSVCFFGDMIEDPEERGDLIPGGLLGEDGHCFDVEEPDPELLRYLEQRIGEAHAHAAS